MKAYLNNFVDDCYFINFQLRHLRQVNSLKIDKPHKKHLIIPNQEPFYGVITCQNRSISIFPAYISITIFETEILKQQAAKNFGAVGDLIESQAQDMASILVVLEFTFLKVK